jgi:hypothetical protein
MSNTEDVRLIADANVIGDQQPHRIEARNAMISGTN